MRWKLDDLIVFRAIVDSGGLTAAGRMLGIPKSTVSSVLQRLESDIGLRLIERTARTVRVTHEGQALYLHATRILDEAEEADATLAGLKTRPSGRVSLAVPGAFCREFIAPNLGLFARQYPEIGLDIAITSHSVDVAGGEFDLAVVVGEQEDSSLAQRKLFAGELIWITSPEYACRFSLGRSTTTFDEHVKICEARYANRPIEIHDSGKAGKLHLRQTVIRVNDPLSVRTAVIEGLGVSFLPARYCGDQLRKGHLVHVWQDVQIDREASQLSVIFPGRKLLAPRCAAVLSFLDEICTGNDTLRERIRGSSFR